MFPRKLPKARKRTNWWRSPAHRKHVGDHECANCGSRVNVSAAHYRKGANAGAGNKPHDWLCVPLCDGPFANSEGGAGCHIVQHSQGEDTFWSAYAKAKGHTVHDLIEHMIRTSPKKGEIEAKRREVGE